MTFLEPALFYGLPLAALPLLIHLFYRRRYRPRDWGAMMFLRRANRERRGRRKLRDALLLLCRALALAALLLAAARPLAGGWVGSVLGGHPRVLGLLLDRSASMETAFSEGGLSKRQEALRRFRDAANALNASKILLIDGATLEPTELASLADLEELAPARATETATNIPALLAAALHWQKAQRADGRVDWRLASDLRRADWKPDDPAWAGQREALEQTRLQVWPMKRAGVDRALRWHSARAIREGKESKLRLEFSVAKSSGVDEVVPLTVQFQTRRGLEVTTSGAITKVTEEIALTELNGPQWGWLELPADANPANNRAYFAFAPAPKSEVVIACQDKDTARVLAAAVGDSARTAPPGEVSAETLRQAGLLCWQGQAPNDEETAAISAFVEAGGQCVVWPSGSPGEVLGFRFGAVETGEFSVNSWRHDAGPLADASTGERLPVNRLRISRRNAPAALDATVWAKFRDERAFLLARDLGEGRIHAWATLPQPDWSSLDEGHLLVPAIQRLAAEGARRLSGVSLRECGPAAVAMLRQAGWKPVSGASDAPGLTGGVWSRGGQTIALARPESEDSYAEISEEELGRLLPGAKLTETAEEPTALWQLALVLMLALLLAEAALCLPMKQRADQA